MAKLEYKKFYHETLKGVLLVSEELFEELTEQAGRFKDLEIKHENGLIAYQLVKENISVLQAENERLREALKFYADDQNWYYELNSDVNQDCGDKARKALESESK